MKKLPWRIDDVALREEKSVFCYSGFKMGHFIRQEGSEVVFGEFGRIGFDVPIQRAVKYPISRHKHLSVEEAIEAAVVAAGFRKSFGIAPCDWRHAHRDLSAALENYRGLDCFVLNMREVLRWSGRLSPKQEMAIRKMAWKLKPTYQLNAAAIAAQLGR